MSEAGYVTAFLLEGTPGLTDQARKELYARVFSTPDGREVLADMVARCGFGLPSYLPSGADPQPDGMRAALDAVFREGQRSAALDCFRLAGMPTGRIGEALVQGRLEAMMEIDDEG